MSEDRNSFQHFDERVFDIYNRYSNFVCLIAQSVNLWLIIAKL